MIDAIVEQYKSVAKLSDLKKAQILSVSSEGENEVAVQVSFCKYSSRFKIYLLTFMHCKMYVLNIYCLLDICILQCFHLLQNIYITFQWWALLIISPTIIHVCLVGRAFDDNSDQIGRSDDWTNDRKQPPLLVSYIGSF